MMDSGLKAKAGDIKILIVDDTRVNTEVLKKYLESRGYQISATMSGEDALQIVPETQPDLILLDIMMPGMDGLEVCRQLKADPSTRAIPVIFITAKTGSEDVIKGFSVGGVDYITKPAQRDEVLARVEAQLNIKHLMTEKQDLIERLQDLNEEINESKNQYDVIVKKVSEVVFQLDADRKVTFINPDFLDILGYDRNEILGRPIDDLIVIEDENMLVQLATRRFNRPTYDLKVKFKVNKKASGKGTGKPVVVNMNSFGLWNLPNDVLLKKDAVEKRFLGTLCIGRKPDVSAT